MTPDIHYVFSDDSVEDAASRMGELQVRRLPVMNRDKRLVGIISIGDVSKSDGATDDSGAALRQIAEPGGRHTQA
jgi:CBS-domain-containing membrane protein